MPPVRAAGVARGGARVRSGGVVAHGLGVALLGAALAMAAGTADAREVRDMLGRAVTVPDRPLRVVSLAPNLTEIVFAVGAGDRLAAVTDQCDFPPEARGKPRVGAMYAPSLEAVVAARPDLVLATPEGNREEHVRALAGVGLTLYLVQPLDFATVLASIERVGELLDRAREAAALVARMRQEAEAIARAVEGARRPRVLYVIWGNPLIVPGRNTLATDLIRRAGGLSVTADEALPYPRLSVEDVLARGAERIVIPQRGQRALAERLREWPALALLPAVREGRVAVVEDDLVHRPGPRVVAGLRALARLLHPERVR
jgi:iron complex transport system substrate-binding protein